MTGKFIAFEGGEGCGKSTQTQLLAQRLGALQTREPGGTEIGAQLRQLMLSNSTNGLADRTEALLMAADRAQHIAEVVQPALAKGQHVVTDRFAGSSIAYQGFGRGLPVEDILFLSQWAANGVWPDLIIYLAVPLNESKGRLPQQLDRMESESDEFHEKVRAGFQWQAENEPERWVVIDGHQSIEQVSAAVNKAVRDRLQLEV